LGIFCGHFDVYFPFWFVVPRKIWQPFRKNEFAVQKFVQGVNVMISKIFSSKIAFFASNYRNLHWQKKVSQH
jgi:ABC-type antimicrobial peptide transport system permease subunit